MIVGREVDIEVALSRTAARPHDTHNSLASHEISLAKEIRPGPLLQLSDAGDIRVLQTETQRSLAAVRSPIDQKGPTRPPVRSGPQYTYYNGVSFHRG